jgi:hypothetical protein
VAGAIILVVVLVVFPLMDLLEGLRKRRADAEAKVLAVQTAVQDTLDANFALKNLQARAMIHPSAAGLPQQTARLLRQLETLPGYRGIEVRRLEGLPLRQEEDFYRSSVSLQFAGTLQNLHQFLQETEGAQPALKVERLTLNTGQKNSARVEGQMVITGYAVVFGKGKKG